MVANSPQDQGGQDTALGIKDQIETAAGQRSDQQFRPFEADACILDDLVEVVLHQGRQDAAVYRLALAGQPGDVRLRPGGAQGPQEGQFHHSVAHQIQPDIDQDGKAAVSHGGQWSVPCRMGPAAEVS